MKRINVECWIGHDQHRNVEIKALQHTKSQLQRNLLKVFIIFFGEKDCCTKNKKKMEKGKTLNIKACAI